MFPNFNETLYNLNGSELYVECLFKAPDQGHAMDM